MIIGACFESMRYLDAFPEYDRGMVNQLLLTATETPSIAGVHFHPGVYRQLYDLEPRGNVHLRGVAGQTVFEPVYGRGRVVKSNLEITPRLAISGITFRNGFDWSEWSLSQRWQNSPIQLAGCTDLHVYDCAFEGWLATCISVASANLTKRVTVERCQFGGGDVVTANGIAVKGIDGLRVRDCEFNDIARGVTTENDQGRHCYNIHVTGNTFRRTRVSTITETNTGVAVHIQPEDAHTRYLIITDNVFLATDGGVDIGFLCSAWEGREPMDAVVERNVISGRVARQSYDTAIAVTRCGGIVIANNVIGTNPESMPHWAIRLRETADFTETVIGENVMDGSFHDPPISIT